MRSPDSDHTAIGQALGYAYQFGRATYHLLDSDSAVVSVAVEHVDDVSVHRTDGTSIREQDKTTISGNRALADRSVALWKTIAIWAEAILSDPGLLRNTEFHIVTNGEVGANSLAARIHSAVAPTEIAWVTTELLGMAKGVRRDLRPFAAKVSELSPSLLDALVGRIFVFDKIAVPFGGNLEQLQSLRLLSPLQRQTVFDSAEGWVRRRVLAAACKHEPTMIDRAAFDNELRALFRRSAVMPLAVVFDAQEPLVDPSNFKLHGFFQQLDWIDVEPSFARDCVIHFVRAQAARVRWTDAGEISESSLRAYEDDLKTRWNLHVQRQLLRTYSSAVAQGRERLLETLAEDSTLDGQPMPKEITCGSFHALADFDARTDPEIGWHPEFANLALAAKSRL